jgi:hypothetical protein
MFESWDKEVCLSVSSLDSLRSILGGKAPKCSPRELEAFEKTKGFVSRASRVYFGHETCARRLPPRSKIIDAIRYVCLRYGDVLYPALCRGKGRVAHVSAVEFLLP